MTVDLTVDVTVDVTVDLTVDLTVGLKTLELKMVRLLLTSEPVGWSASIQDPFGFAMSAHVLQPLAICCEQLVTMQALYLLLSLAIGALIQFMPLAMP